MKKLLLILIIVTLHSEIYAQLYVKVDTITFESPDTLLKIDTAAGNIWQIGRPQKSFFDSSFSAPNAIVTDTIDPYPINNLSIFTIKIADTVPAQSPWFPGNLIRFWTKYDTDSLKDGGNIEVSYDDQMTWSNVVKDTAFFITSNSNSYWNSVNDGYPGFSGRSSGWEYIEIIWCGDFYFSTTPVYVRFVFVSDSIQTNKEGWMIDNITLYPYICEGIPQIQNNDLISVFPNPADDQLTISRTRKTSHEAIQIFDFTGKLILEDNNFKEESVNTSQFHNGIYLIRYSDGKNYSLKRFIVVHDQD